MVCLSTEIEQGNVEYKYRLTGCVTNENRRHQLVSEGRGRVVMWGGAKAYRPGRGVKHQCGCRLWAHMVKHVSRAVQQLLSC